jgi:hypothetical protein
VEAYQGSIYTLAIVQQNDLPLNEGLDNIQATFGKQKKDHLTSLTL